MSPVELTKDSDALISALYKEYLQKRQKGISKGKAKLLGSAENIHQNVVSKWDFDDVEETLWELSRAGFLDCMPADNTVWMATLTDSGIIYMESRFKNGLSEVLDYVEQIKSILLW